MKLKRLLVARLCFYCFKEISSSEKEIFHRIKSQKKMSSTVKASKHQIENPRNTNKRQSISFLS